MGSGNGAPCRPLVALHTVGPTITGGWDWQRVRENLVSPGSGSTSNSPSDALAVAPVWRECEALRFVTRLLDAPTCADIVTETLEGCFELLPVSATGLDFLHPTSGTPLQVTGKGVTRDFLYLYEQNLRGHDVVLREAVATRLPRQSSDLFSEEEWRASAAYRLVFQTQRLAHIIYVPLIAGGQVVGTLNLGRPQSAGRFTAAEVALLVDLAGIVTRILVRELSTISPTPSPPQPGNAPVLDVLSCREREIARLIGRGLHDHEIAKELTLSPHTVKQHLKRIYRKTEVRSRVELAARIATR